MKFTAKQNGIIIDVIDDDIYLGYWERYSEGWRWYPDPFTLLTLTLDRMAEMVEHVQSVEKKRLEEEP